MNINLRRERRLAAYLRYSGAMTRQDGFTLIELLAALAIIGIICAIAVPITDTSLKANRLRGDADSVRNLVGLAKMRASSQFTRARVFVNLPANSYALQTWDKTASAWTTVSGPTPLSTGVTFGFGTLATPPPNTQVNIGLSPECTNGLTAAGAIANTACVTFNSRGLPIDASGNLYPRHALYLRGETGVFATTVTSTPLIRFWSSPNKTAKWTAK
jgi:prepilin-type N-terminal cleavage/methylation domain-containing protein